MKIRRLLKKIYSFGFRPFFKNGVTVNIGGAGKYRFDYIFAFSKFGKFGDRHNSGFNKWLCACKDKKTIFDIGAHIGLYSIPASSVIDKDGVIYAFEPSSKNGAYLSKHISFNKITNVKVMPYLVGDKPESAVPFYESYDVDPMNSVAIRKDFGKYSKTVKEQISLDDYCSKNTIVPEIIKIDVEGSEFSVLKGAENVLREYSPVVFLSIHPRILKLMNQPLEELIQFIDRLGYDIYGTCGKKAEEFKHSEYILIPKGSGSNEIF